MKWNKVSIFGSMRTVYVRPCWSYTQNKRVLAHRREIEYDKGMHKHKYMPRLMP